MEERRQALATAVRRRRLQLGLSVSAAAAAAGINRLTWNGIEAQDRRMQEHNYANVEKALAWAPGSIERILAGSDPEEVRPCAQCPPAADAEACPMLVSAISYLRMRARP